MSLDRVASDVRASAALERRSSLMRPTRTISTRTFVSLRATVWIIAMLALSAAWMSSTTNITGVSAAAAVTVFKSASAILSGISSGDHSTGFGTPGNCFRISELIRVSSLSASGSALPIARCVANCLTSSPSTANGSSRSASYACARATTAPSI